MPIATRRTSSEGPGEEKGRGRGRGGRVAGSTLHCMACIFCLQLAKSWSLALFSSTDVAATVAAGQKAEK